MICLLCRGARATRHASRQSSCSVGIIAALSRCAIPHIDFAAQCRLMLARKRHSVRHPACTDVLGQQISGFRTASRHLNFGHHARGITPLRWARRRITLSFVHLASVKRSKRLPDKTVGGPPVPNCVRGSPTNHRSQLYINTQRRLRLPRLQVPLRYWLAPLGSFPVHGISVPAHSLLASKKFPDSFGREITPLSIEIVARLGACFHENSPLSGKFPVLSPLAGNP
jgi:hypothetical protein